MIRLDTANVDQTVVGQSHGLDVKAIFAEYQEKLGKAVESLWKSRHEANQWTGWLALAESDDVVNSIKTYAQSIKGQFEHFVIVGIGGSALGATAMFEALLPSNWNDRSREQRQNYPKYYVVDNVDPDQLAEFFEVLDLPKTLVCVITKSGTTAETMAGYLWLREALVKSVGADKLKNHLVMITDPEKGLLRKIVNEEGLQAFPVPANVGGRFSIFSAVGLLPAAVLGLPIDDLVKGIRDITPTLQSTDINQNIASQNALIQFLLYRRGKNISVFMPYSAKLASTADWYVQLWAESLGKRLSIEDLVVYEGPTPLKAVGVTDQHSQVQLFNEGPFDKIFTFIRLEKFQHKLTIPNLYPNDTDLNYLGNKTFEALMQAEGDATRASLTTKCRPNVTITLPQLDAQHFAQLLFMLEVQTAIAGRLLEVDPFDQPGVELGKQYTYALMGRPGFENLKSEVLGKQPETVG